MDKKRSGKKLKIALVYEFLSEQGGLEREIISHAHFLREEGHEVKILTCHYDPKIRNLLPFGDLSITTLGKFNTPNEFLNLALCGVGLHNATTYKADITISYSFPANYLLRKNKAIKVNYVNHFLHAFYLTEREKREWAFGTQGFKRKFSYLASFVIGDWVRKKDRKLIKKNELLFMNSEFTKNRLEKLYGVKGVVSYPPLDKAFSKPSPKIIGKKFIFSSSRIIPDKKYEWLIEAVAHMENKLPLWLAGSVEKTYKMKLIHLAKKMNVELVFLGKISTSDIINYYASAKLFAFPTPGEDFGLVPAESLACGTPVVAWGDGAGPTEQIIDGVNGYLAEPYNKKNFANKMDEIVKSNFKEKNKKQIVDSAKKFTYEECKNDFLQNLYQKLSLSP